MSADVPRPSEADEDHEVASPSSYLGINAAVSPRAAAEKSVSIAPEAEVISPMMLGGQKNDDEFDLDSDQTSRKHHFKRLHSKRLSGRPPIHGSGSSPSLNAHSEIAQDSPSIDPQMQQSEHFADQISDWIKEERLKHANRKAKRAAQRARSKEATARQSSPGVDGNVSDRRESDASDGAASLDKLEGIIKHALKIDQKAPRRPHGHRRTTSLKKPQRKASSASSDTDYYEGGDVFVPSCDAILDNSKTLAYTGGASDDSDETSSGELHRTTSYRDLDAWQKFKFEIVRLTHTLRLKGWRKVSMDMSSDISVQRLSGALTNAVYVVSPPSVLPLQSEGDTDRGGEPKPKKPPPKLLLRIYGPQVEHLIDRDAELAILRRLARKKIGPRLLGTFGNGRFEEYFYAETLTPEDLHHPDTSKQIAKRMRELHDGIELLDEEREAGAFVWRNWDKWVQRVEQVMMWLDSQVMQLPAGAKPTGPDAWKRRGLICGAPWKQFREMVEKYRAWLVSQYGGAKNIQSKLVFAHNDTQYGNILRLMPQGESPLLMPANTHKRLVVIDFEYANANLPGLEFANHFTEWCYNYHDPRRPYAMHPAAYPNPEEQARFIRAYVRHRPQYNVSTPKLTATPSSGSINTGAPVDLPNRRPTSSISYFMLDARTPSTDSTATAANAAAPPTSQLSNEEAARKAAEDDEVQRLMHQTRIWRLANTAQWVAWGAVQAKVAGMPEFSGAEDDAAAAEQGDLGEDAGREALGDRADFYREKAAEHLKGEGKDGNAQIEEVSTPGLEEAEEGEDNEGEGEGEEVEEEFDYLGYAQHRALFFWGDALQMGFVREEELPVEVRGKVKKVPF